MSWPNGRCRLGQRVATGALADERGAFVQVYVDANFKEIQLRKVRFGQPVELTADRYGKSVVSMAGCKDWLEAPALPSPSFPLRTPPVTGSRWFSGFRFGILLDSKDVEQHPLRVGLSMVARIDVAAPADGGRSRPTL